MFGAWSGGNQPTPSSIKEANEQLHAMHNRIVDLEQRVKEQMELLERREAEFGIRYRQMVTHKDGQIRVIEKDLEDSENKRIKLEAMMKERDVQIAFMLHRCSYLDEAASYAPLLDQLSQCLKNAFASPPPKVQSVKPTRVGTSAETRAKTDQNQPDQRFVGQNGSVEKPGPTRQGLNPARQQQKQPIQTIGIPPTV